ncbi:MAG TPA: response regulator transcription factor [Vineibacter sp.]|nr:response regulator transcription factor [Vineibacter sp.]
MTRVLVIDDHPIVLHGCRRVLEDAGADEILEASNPTDGYSLYQRQQPDVVIVDLAMQGKGFSGLDLIRRLRQRNEQLPILVFSMHGDPVIVSSALDAGATGYLLKDTTPEDLLEAFDRVRRGLPYLSHQIATQVALLRMRTPSKKFGAVTPRELQTLALLAEGHSYGQIADDLGVSYKTVVNMCSQLKVKLGARNFPDLIRTAIEYLSSSPARS